MKKIIKPPTDAWENICRRPTLISEQLDDKVQAILKEVAQSKDAALRQFALQFNQASLTELKVSESEMEEARQQITDELKQAIQVAAVNIERFHTTQKTSEEKVETTPGVICWRKAVAIETVGLYIPGGSAPLFSTILMLAIPAKIAGCKQIVLCTPCGENGKINPVVLFTASYLGITEIYKVGGAQAIAAMAYGTESIKKVDKIFGPGNQFVTKAKELVQKSGMAIDLPAGPSEVLILADSQADADFVAADLLSQAEHGPDSQVVLVTNDMRLIDHVTIALAKQLKTLPRQLMAQKALENSFVVYFESIEECIEFSNVYAPEHLILAIQNADSLVNAVQNAGSVFLGNYSCESAGDYASGTNHTLPTNGYARSYSGVSLDSFTKKITFQKLSSEGILNLGPTIELMAEAEQLWAHKNAVTIRLNKLKNK
ncbi:MAG: histidinol dehydrogenase [Bacteroidetes bacterium]|nr:histidinol dehydrogenase [Bacteroidota bacterium]